MRSAVGVGAAARPSRALPQGVELLQDGQDLVLARRWLTLGGAGLVVTWQCVAVLMLAAVARGLGGSPMRWGVCIIVGVGLYVAAAVALNRTEVRVGPGRLRLGHGPVPCPGWGPRARHFALTQMAQFTVRADPHRGQACLRLRLKSGQEVPLAAFSHPDGALCVEALFRNQLAQSADLPRAEPALRGP